jgi:hypothetical protein
VTNTRSNSLVRPAPKDPAAAEPTDAAIIERAQSFANEAMHTIVLQRRRLHSEEPEDATFVFRYWADLQFLITSLRRLRRAAELAAKPERYRRRIKLAIQVFDDELPDLRKMRNVGEHLDEYAVDRGLNRRIDRRDLQAGNWDGTTFEWLGGALNIEEAVAAAERLYEAVRDASREASTQS